MSLGGSDSAGSLIYNLMRLVQSPRVQYGVNSLKRALPSMSGPLVGNAPSFSRGASAHNPGQQQQNPINPAATGAFANLGSILSQYNPNQPQDPMAALYDQLVGQLQQPVQQPTGINTEDLMNQVKAAINPIYDQREQTARDQTGRATQEVQGMYGALADDYKKLAPEQIKQAQEQQAEIEQLYGQLRSNITGDFSRVSDDQSELFKQLGIESALPDVLQQQTSAVTDATTAAAENEAQQSQRYNDIGQMDASFYREGSPNALMAGNEISTDLLSQLGDYINQSEADRTSGIQTGYLDQLGQAQSQLAQQQNSAQSEAARRQEMLWQMLQTQMQGQNSQQQQALTPDTFMSQLPQNQQAAVAGAFTQLQRSPEAVYGKVQDPRNPVPGTFVDTNPEWYMSQADKMLQSGQIDPVTHQALLMYMNLYFGMGK